MLALATLLLVGVPDGTTTRRLEQLARIDAAAAATAASFEGRDDSMASCMRRRLDDLRASIAKARDDVDNDDGAVSADVDYAERAAAAVVGCMTPHAFVELEVDPSALDDNPYFALDFFGDSSATLTPKRPFIPADQAGWREILSALLVIGGGRPVVRPPPASGP